MSAPTKILRDGNVKKKRKRRELERSLQQHEQKTGAFGPQRSSISKETGIDLPLEISLSLSLSFFHTHTHARAHTHTHSLCLSYTQKLRHTDTDRQMPE